MDTYNKGKDLEKREDVYGIKKKVLFIAEKIEEYRRRRKLDKENCSILDVGCGTGINVALPLASLGYHLTAIDPDPGSIEMARKMNRYPNATFAHTDLERVTETYHVIICTEVLEHLAAPKSFLETLKRLLTPDGIIILTVPNGYGGFEFEKLAHGLGLRYLISLLSRMKLLKLPPAESIPNTLRERDVHLQHFTLKKLIGLLRETGLGVLEHRNSTLLGGPITNSLFWQNEKFIKWNAKVADEIKSCLASGWFLVLRKDDFCNRYYNQDILSTAPIRRCVQG